MADILKEVLKFIPDSAVIISDAVFEGANIVLYTKKKEFFLNNNGLIKEIVNNIKKRVELRADPSITLDQEKAEDEIKKLLPKDAGLSQILFDPQRSIVILETEKPGVAIGKSGEILKKIKEKTLWITQIKRTPSIKSKLIENIRAVLYENNDYRRKFLHKIGKRIYDGWTKERRQEWIRVTFLGAARHVGRSCILLQTPESKVLLDCGVDIASEENQFPILDVPEFNLNELDAVVLSHSHLDHSGLIPYLMKMGYRGPIYCTLPTRDISALLSLDFIGIAQKEAKDPLFSSTDVKEMVKHTVVLDYEEVTDITPDIRITLYDAGHVLGSAMVHIHVGNGLHNLLYSLDWKTPVTVIDKRDSVFFKPIGEIVDKNFDKFSNLVTKKDIYEELPNIEGLKTVVFNHGTYKTEIKPITSFIRHPVTEDLYELKTATGRKITVTKSHSVFSVKNGNVFAVKVCDLNEGDFIIGPKKIPLLNREPEINLLKYAPKLRIRVDNTELLNNILTKYKSKLNNLKENDKREALNWIIEHYKFASYKYEIAKKYKVHVRRISRVFNQLNIEDHPRVKHIFPAKFKINKDFARFLGYYIAEGHIRKNSQTIQISNTNYKILEDCYNIIKNNFEIIGDIRYKDDVILFHSKQLNYLISEILKCGKNAYIKRVPSQILLSSQEIISNLLYGYFSGDGGIINERDGKGRTISCSSKSYNLIQDIIFLLLQFGIVPTITYNNYTKIHIASIYNSSKIKEFLEKIGIENKHLISLVPNLVRKKNKGSFDLRIPLFSLSRKGQFMLSRTSWRNAKSCNIRNLKEMDLSDLDKKLVNSDLMFDQIKEIKKVKPTNKYVYDFKVKGYENFLGGDGFLFLHNTGDLNYEDSNLLHKAVTKFPRLESVIMESTYGGRDDNPPSRQECENELIEIIKKTIERKGKVLIPVLGVGRAQEIMLIVEKCMRNKLIPDIPVYVQGMVWDVTAIHTAYPDFFNVNVRKAIFHKDQNPFLSKIFKHVGSQKEMQEVIEGGPCLILATSGMMTGGASVEYFKALADSNRNTVVLVSYQGPGSLGRRLENGDREIRISENETIKVKLNVHALKGFSGHSSRDQLMDFVKMLDPKPKKIILVHGENSKCLDLASSIHKVFRIETIAPRTLDTVRIR